MGWAMGWAMVDLIYPDGTTVEFLCDMEIIPEAWLENAQILDMTPLEVWDYFAPFMRLDYGPLIDAIIRDSAVTREMRMPMAEGAP